MRTAQEFIEGLRDDREVWYRGERVADVTTHPELGVAARHGSLDFELAEDPALRELAVTDGHSTFYALPRTAADLRRRSALIEASTAHGATLVVLLKEIGTDALFALHRVTAGTDAFARVQAFHARCRDGDLALAVAQTDVKGDRSQGPSGQADPDAYVRIVDRRDDGIVVRGAKVHTSCSPNVDELIVIPTRALREGEEEWAVAFAVPVATPGVRLLCSDYLHGTDDPWTRPVSSRHKMIETLTVFDDVFVPWERVFLAGDVERAGRLALAFVEFHRFTAVSYKLPLVDTLVGLALALAEANGIARASHVRDKLTWLIGYAETVRGLTELAADRCGVDPATGIAFPDPLTTNVAKWTFARDYQEAVKHVIDVAGGLLVTGPSGADWEHPELRPLLEKYLAGAVPAAERMALLNLASDLLARSYAGYQSVLAVHAEGSLEAEKLQIWRSYDAERARTLARRLAGLGG
ncbi:MAG TPA: 4-hydroxyphenylacetate 3-hydroxylase N-terminal domain-containing protein [Gaiellaceae bacterium]|nr:4-hydroxyphenylacetate 3-hydroxylase N-terminal domain-containing protein [Gaiellaceae bacterium]